MDTDGDNAAELLCACWLLHALLKYRRDAAVAAMPAVASAMQALFTLVPAAVARAVLARANSRGSASANAAVVDGSVGESASGAVLLLGSQGLHNPAMALLRAAEVFARVVRPMRYHAMHVLAAALCTLAQLRRALRAGGALAAAAQRAVGPAGARLI